MATARIAALQLLTFRNSEVAPPDIQLDDELNGEHIDPSADLSRSGSAARCVNPVAISVNIRHRYCYSGEFNVISKQYTPQVFSFFMALLMSCIMSFIISVFNVGLVDSIVLIWLKAWLFAFIVAFPTIILITPTVRKLVAVVVGQN